MQSSVSGTLLRKRGRTSPTSSMARHRPIIGPGPDAKRQRLSGSPGFVPPKLEREPVYSEEEHPAPIGGYSEGDANTSVTVEMSLDIVSMAFLLESAIEPPNKMGQNGICGGVGAGRQIAGHGALSDDGFELVGDTSETFEDWVQVEGAPEDAEFVIIDNPSVG